MKKRRVLIVLGVVLVLAVGAGVLLLTQGNARAQATNVQLGRVSRATLLSTVDSSGSVSPESSITLSFGASGTVSKVNVQPGDRVKKGDVLAELDTSDLELQIAQQEQAYLIQQASYSMTIQPDPAAVAAAQTALSNASAAYKVAQQKYAVNSTDQVALSCSNLDSARQTYDDAVTAYNNYLSNWRVVVYGTYQVSPQKAQLDRATAAYDVALASCSLAKNSVNDTGVKSAFAQLQQAKANLDKLISPSEQTLTAAKVQLDQARVSLEQARRQLDYARIVAPLDGVVTQVNAVAGGAGGGATILLADVSQYHVKVLVDETEIAQVQVGQKVEMTFDALPKAAVTGTVGLIAPAGTVSQGVVNYTVRVDLEPTDAAMRIDMSANVRVILDAHANVLAVPGGAIRQDATGYYVNVANTNGEATRVDVTTGFTDGDLTEVSGNLQPNERVYISEPPRRQQGGFNLFGIRLGGG